MVVEKEHVKEQHMWMNSSRKFEKLAKNGFIPTFWLSRTDSGAGSGKRKVGSKIWRKIGLREKNLRKYR